MSPLQRRILAEQVEHALCQAGADRALLTAPDAACGLTDLAGLLRIEIAPTPVLPVEALAAPEPPAGLFVGPPLLETAGLALRREQCAPLDAAILVVLGRRTARQDIIDAHARLTALGLPIAGVVWNEQGYLGGPGWWRRLTRRAKPTRVPTAVPARP